MHDHPTMLAFCEFNRACKRACTACTHSRWCAASLHAYIRVRMHTHTHTHTCMRTYTWLDTCMHTYQRTHTHIYCTNFLFRRLDKLPDAHYIRCLRLLIQGAGVILKHRSVRCLLTNAPRRSMKNVVHLELIMLLSPTDESDTFVVGDTRGNKGKYSLAENASSSITHNNFAAVEFKHQSCKNNQRQMSLCRRASRIPYALSAGACLEHFQSSWLQLTKYDLTKHRRAFC